jgi:hypothetical protein
MAAAAEAKNNKIIVGAMLPCTTMDYKTFGGIKLASADRVLGFVHQMGTARHSITKETIGVMLYFQMNKKSAEARDFAANFRGSDKTISVFVMHDNLVPKVIMLCPPDHVQVQRDDVVYLTMSSVTA